MPVRPIVGHLSGEPSCELIQALGGLLELAGTTGGIRRRLVDAHHRAGDLLHPGAVLAD